MKKNNNKPITYLILGILILLLILIGSLTYSYNQSLIAQINSLTTSQNELKRKFDAQSLKLDAIENKFLPNYADIINSFEMSFNAMNKCIAAVSPEKIAECESTKAQFESAKQIYSSKISENVKIIKDNELSK